MVSRSDRRTETSKQPEYYRDFLTDFSRNPVTGYLSTVRNEASVKQSIRNLILTSPGERPKSSSRIGARVHKLLFEQLDSVTLDLLSTEIRSTIENHEPRANLLSVRVQELKSQSSDETVLAATIVFYVQNAPAPTSMTVDIKRVR